MNRLFIFFIICFLSIHFINADCLSEYQCEDWGECIDGLRVRNCFDINCDSENIIEREFCGASDCEPNLECGEWGNCLYFDKINDVLSKELRFEGEKERICFDKNNCVDSFIEKSPCSESVPIKIEKTDWCGQEYVGIFDANQNLVARVKETQILADFRKVDISFVSGQTTGYCFYCFDGEKNYDELNVDCGGESCPECVEEVIFVDWLSGVIFASWVGFFLFFIILIMSSLISLNRKGISVGEKLKSILIFFKPLNAEEEKAREEQIVKWVKGITSGGQVLREDGSF